MCNLLTDCDWGCSGRGCECMVRLRFFFFNATLIEFSPDDSGETKSEPSIITQSSSTDPSLQHTHTPLRASAGSAEAEVSGSETHNIQTATDTHKIEEEENNGEVQDNVDYATTDNTKEDEAEREENKRRRTLEMMYAVEVEDMDGEKIEVRRILAGNKPVMFVLLRHFGW